VRLGHGCFNHDVESFTVQKGTGAAKAAKMHGMPGSNEMRFLVTVVCAALLPARAWAQSTWTEFNNPELGFVVSFPADPAVGHMTVKAPYASDADETMYAVSAAAALFSVAVIDFK